MEIAEAFFAASRSGDMSGLQALLAADVAFRSDGGGKKPAVPAPVFGLDDVLRLHAALAKLFTKSMSSLVRYCLIDGLPGFVTVEADDTLQTTALSIDEGKVTGIYVVRNPDKLAHVARTLQ